MKIVADHPDCGAGKFALVNDMGEVDSCHPSEEAAQQQMDKMMEMKSANPGECFRSVPFELRAKGDGLTLEGYAAVYNDPTRIDSWEGRFDEVILPGAFTRALSKRTPVLMFEHGRHPLVGSMPLGVITRASDDNKGLYIEARLSDNWLIQPVRDAVRDGAVNGMSFRFSVTDGDTWTRRKGDVDLRAIREFDDVPELGPVVFPAYEPTTATVRSLVERLPDLARRAAEAAGDDAQPGNGAASTLRSRVDHDALRLRGILR